MIKSSSLILKWMIRTLYTPCLASMLIKLFSNLILVQILYAQFFWLLYLKLTAFKLKHVFFLSGYIFSIIDPPTCPEAELKKQRIVEIETNQIELIKHR